MGFSIEHFQVFLEAGRDEMSDQIPRMFSGRSLFTLSKHFLEFDNLEAPSPNPQICACCSPPFRACACAR